MRTFLRLLALLSLLFLSCAEVRAQSAAGSDPTPATQPANSDPAAPHHSKRVWTNENIGTVAGDISVVGVGSSRSGRRSARAISGDGLSIISPSAGTVVRPGEALHIEVSVDSGKEIPALLVYGPMGTANEIRESPPWSFILSVPTDDGGIGGPLIGIQPIFAIVGGGGHQKDMEGAATEVDVEDATPATTLWPRIGLLSFDDTGELVPMDVVAKFADGRELEVTRSTGISFASTDTSVATVDDDGTVKSVGPGKAEIQITYVGGGATTKLSVHVESWAPRSASPADQNKGSSQTQPSIH
jgi:hypothetical protein